MATRKPTTTTKPQPTGRTFSNTGGGFTPIEIGEEVSGEFVAMRMITIPDRVTREKKQIRCYVIKTAEGVIQIGSKALLDSLYDEVVETVGPINGKQVVIRRGEDVDSAGGQSMSTWEMDVL